MLIYHDPIIVDGESIQVYETDFDGWHHFHAVCMGVNAKTYEELRALVIQRWEDAKHIEVVFSQVMYEAQYAYACGYHD